MTSMIPLTNLKKTDGHAKGFTLLELLIVIAIIAILSIALVFMLNPAETLKKARDAQRISDLKTVKTALGVMLTATSTPSLDGTFGAATATGICLTTADGSAVGLKKIAYSLDSSATITLSPVPTAGVDAVPAYATFIATGYTRTGASAGMVTGAGWIPINLKTLIGGSPIASFPVDPVNTIALTAPASTDLVYRYACQNGTLVATGKPSFIFEIDAVLESNAYNSMMTKDGGDNDYYYESGNSLNLLPATIITF